MLDGHKLPWHLDRIHAWERGELIAPVTMDVAWTTRCNARCHFCAAAYQTGERASIPRDRIKMFLEDAAEMGVRGMVTMSDGESTLHPYWAESIRYGKSLGMDMAAASNGYTLLPELAEKVLPYLTYLRLNISAGEPGRYSQIMGVPMNWWERVTENIRHMAEQKRKHGYGVTINISMVLHPDNADQILPFARLGRDLGVDYAIIKHCLDYSGAPMGVDYSKYEEIDGLLVQAEAISTPDYLVTTKRFTMRKGNVQSPKYCYGPQFLLQVSGSGLLAACGPLFAPRYAEKYHIGNICETRLIDLWRSPRYQEVMDYLRSEHFAKTKDCGRYLCVQRHINEALAKHLSGERFITEPETEPPEHRSFI